MPGKTLTLLATVLTVAYFLNSSADAAGPYVMPTGAGGGMPDDGSQPFDPNPAANGSRTRQFLTYGVDSDGNTIPLKTLRITNNTQGMVFPVMRDPNSNVLESNPAIGLYDPYDPPNKEYRGYIGYEENGTYYFGLKQGQSILVSVPLVFWNGARIGVGTDGEFLAPTTLPNPLRYDPNGHRSIANAETSADTISNGVVMWYRAEIPQAPNDDTEDQLAEWTFRDHAYLNNPQITAKTNSEIPDNQLVTLINYDVSNVDNLFLPLAMAANDVWVIPQSSGPPPNPNRDGWAPGSVPEPYGWTGAVNTIDFLQGHIREFTANENELLGEYFEGRGWPFYNIPASINDPDGPRKIPSGANIFAQSPIKAVPSSYGDGTWQNDRFMLSSGGTEPIAATIGWAGGTPDTAGSTTLHVNLAEAEKIAFLKPGFFVKGLPPASPPTPNPIQDGTTVVSVDTAAGSVELSKPLVDSSENCAFEFTRPVHDYAAEAMIRLWYSWAEYFRAHWRDENQSAPTAPVQIVGSIEVMTATLHFNEAHPELVEGMKVTGPGLDDAQTEVGIHQGDALILEIASDQKSVILSQVVNKTSTNAAFTFSPPQELLWTPKTSADPGYPLIHDKFVFGNEPAWHNPYEFSQAVYLVMASMNQIGHPNNDNVNKFMQDVVGANMGFIFTNEAKKAPEADMVTAMIRDMVKSVLRGVSDFTKYPDTLDDQGNHIAWYPDPKLSRGNQPFNVFNLDPFVWFVHVQLGFSGYGFSVDDDTADVGAGGAAQLQLSVTETGGLKNTHAWTVQAPFGPIRNVMLPYSGPASATNGDTQYFDLASVSNTTPITVTAKVEHKLANGATIIIDSVTGDPAANGTFKVGNVTKFTFDLFDVATDAPIAPAGAYTGGGRWGYPLRPYVDTGADLTKVFYRVTGDDALGTFLGTFVSVNGVDRNPNKPDEKFRVWNLGSTATGRLILDADLTDAAGNPLPAGTYSFDFFGIAETVVVAPLPPPLLSNALVLDRLMDRLDDAQKIDDPDHREEAIDRVRGLLKLVRRDIDLDSRKGQLLRRLINARTLDNPDRRKKLVKRLRNKLRRLRN